MKIAMVHTMYAPRLYGGAERVIQRVAEGLVGAGHEVVVVAAGPRGEAETRELHGVRVIELELANLYWPYGQRGAISGLEGAWHLIDLWNPVMAKRAARVIGREAPDVVHTHGLVGFSTRVWRELATFPIVHTLHDHRLECVHAAMFKNGRACTSKCVSCRATAMLKRPAASEVDLVVGVSRSVLDSHLTSGFFAQAEQAVIPVPLEPAPAPASIEPSNVLRLGYLGRLQPGKGVEVLISATRELPPGGWRLLIAGDGDGSYVEHVEGLARHANVRFVGRVNANEFLDELDALIVPSQLTESAGLVVPEAFARGVPVIGASRGGVAEAISSGQTGYLYDPDDAESLRAVISRILRSSRELRGMRESCFREAEKYSVGRIVAAYVDCYERAMTAKRLRTVTSR